MDISKLTLSDISKLAGLLCEDDKDETTKPANSDKAIPVVVCTDKRGVVFGYCQNVDARPLTLTDARMCLYWSADVGGVFGLGDVGPTNGCKISATLSQITLEGVTAVFSVKTDAEKAWVNAPIQGRK